MIDFGSSLAMPDGWSPRLAALLQAGRDRDTARLFDIAASSGLIDPEEVTGQALLDLTDPLLEPLRHDTFEFTRGWLRAQTTRFSDPRSETSRTQRKLRVPAHYMLVQRVAAGTAGVLCSLSASVPVRHEAEYWLPIEQES